MIIIEEIENWSEEIDLVEEEIGEDLFEDETEFEIEFNQEPTQKDVSFTKKGEIRKRKPKTEINYFTSKTQEAIIEYLKTEDTRLKNKIFNEHIYYAFYKLSENIIHTFKFYYTEVIDLEDLKFEIISVLIEKIHLFHHSKNINDKLNKIINRIYKEKYINGSFIEYTNNAISVTQDQIDIFIKGLNISDNCRQELSKITPPKAYSYFGTIVKRYLINYNKNNFKRLKNQTDPLEADFDSGIIIDLENEFNKFDHSTEDFYKMYINYMDQNLENIFSKEHELKISGAVLSIFKNQHTLSLVDKKAIYLYIKEMVGDLPTRYITKVLKEFNIQYKKLYNKYENTGTI